MAGDPGLGSGPIGKFNGFYTVTKEIDVGDGVIETMECEVVSFDPGFDSGPSEENQDMTNEPKDDFIEGCSVDSPTPGEVKMALIQWSVIALVVICLTITSAGPQIITALKSCPAAVQIR